MSCFHHIFMDRIVREKTATNSGICHRFFRIKCAAVILADCLPSGNSRQKIFSAATESRHHMMNGSTNHDHFSSYNKRVYFHSRTAGCCSYIYKIFAVTIMIDNCDMFINIRGTDLHQFLRCGSAMCSQCDHHRDPVKIDTDLIMQIRYQQRHDLVLMHPAPGNITHHDRNVIFFGYDFF